MANKPKQNNKGGAMDICQTPPHALEPLYPYLPLDTIIWESACGPERLLVRTLQAKGYKVHSTDLLYGQNRFTYKHDLVKWIEVTNVPFSLKYQWLEQAFEDNMPFAFLAPYETTAAGTFHKLVAKYGQVEVLAPERRINYKMPNKGWGGTAQMPTCWITRGLDVFVTREPSFLTYTVPMRSVQYDSDNNPIERGNNVKKRYKDGENI